MPELGKQLDDWLKKHQSEFFMVGNPSNMIKASNKFTKIQDAITFLELEKLWPISAIYNSQDEIIMIFYQGKWFSIC